jgi:hypothetical protein
MTSTTKAFAAASLLGCLVASPSEVHARLVTWRATGTLIVAPATEAIPTAAVEGDAFRIEAVFDTDTPCTAPCQGADEGYAYYAGAIRRMTVAFADWSFEVPPAAPQDAYVLVEQDQPISGQSLPNGGFIDRYIFSANTARYFTGPWLPPSAPIQYLAQLSLESSGALRPDTPITDLRLPTAPPDVRGFQQARMALFAFLPSTQSNDAAVGDVSSVCLVDSRGDCTDLVGFLLDALHAKSVGVGPGRSLANKIRVAEARYAASDMPATCGVLTGFVHQVRAQRGAKIDAGLADALVADVREIMTALACG